MEESMTETEAHQSFRSPPRRRRSTFFERRDSLVPQALTENDVPKPCKSNAEGEEIHKQELSKYHDKLLSEKEQWKKEVKHRRNIYHDLRQQYQMAVKASSKPRMSYAVLSNDDIDFIKAKQNISKLVDSQKKLHKDVEFTKALYRRACELDNVALSYCKSKVKKITEYILEHSTVEPME